MSDTELYGLMVLAKEHQANAEKAGKALAAAAHAYSQAQAELKATAQQEIRAAVAAEATAMAVPLRQAAQEATEVARATKAALARVDWAWLAAMFACGLIIGSIPHWWIYRAEQADQEERLRRIENTIFAIYSQTPEGKAAAAKRK